MDSAYRNVFKYLLGVLSHSFAPLCPSDNLLEPTSGHATRLAFFRVEPCRRRYPLRSQGVSVYGDLYTAQMTVRGGGPLSRGGPIARSFILRPLLL